VKKMQEKKQDGTENKESNFVFKMSGLYNELCNW